MRVYSCQPSPMVPPVQRSKVAPNRIPQRRRKDFLLRWGDDFGFFVRLDATHDQAGIGAAKTEAIGQSHIDLTLLGSMSHPVDHALA